MPKRIERDELLALVDAGAQLAEVLPAAEYTREHLPGAINLPLASLDEGSASRLDPTRAVVAYCYDYE